MGAAVFLSDFLGDLSAVEAALAQAVGPGRARARSFRCWTRRRRSFPSTGGRSLNAWAAALRHETLRAGDLRGRYLARLAERKDRLATLARAVGLACSRRTTPATAAQAALLWLYRALERGR